MAKGKTADTEEAAAKLYRVVKFQIFPTALQLQTLLRVSDGLREIWNLFLGERTEVYKKYRVERDAGVAKPLIKFPTLFDQINALTALGKEDARLQLSRAKMPRNWKEEALDTLNGSFQSWLALMKKGDTDARPPWERRAERFTEISGRSGFKIETWHVGEISETLIEYAPTIFGRKNFAFPLPKYCADLIRDRVVKKFTLYRDEPDLEREGNYWISLAYEIDRPEPRAFSTDAAVYLALGASFIGVHIPTKADFIIDLWRPDKYWKPKIDGVTERMKGCTKNSKQWRTYNASRNRMYTLMAHQQKQNQREVTQRLLAYGCHFVVQDLVVRSKKGKLADASKPERGGALGLNWSVQNTGSIARFVSHLDEKAKEYGGFVTKHRPTVPPPTQSGRDNKIAMAQRLHASMQLEDGVALTLHR